MMCMSQIHKQRSPQEERNRQTAREKRGGERKGQGAEDRRGRREEEREGKGSQLRATLWRKRVDNKRKLLYPFMISPSSSSPHEHLL